MNHHTQHPNDQRDTQKWINDISSLEQVFPQGTMIRIKEQGTADRFIWKLQQRLCGRAHPEIMQQAKRTLEEYIAATKKSHPHIAARLSQYNNVPKCTFPNTSCTSPCSWGKNALKRNI
ncbi:hypothetical protein JW887_05275 [Candidatus Dojkabacteria bacterium]|nr:hypothetical protein [Candidatus Dojkabacteria bacterium]